MRGALRYRDVGQAQIRTRHIPLNALVRVLSWSIFRVEEAPDDGSDIVEELEGVVSVLTLKGMNSGKKAKMGVNLFR